MDKKNILMTTGASEMTSGASHSFVELIGWLEANSRFHVIALLEKKGSLCDELEKRGIETFVIPQKEIWYKWIDKKNEPGTNPLKELLRPLAVKYGYLKIDRLLKDKEIKLVHINGLTRGMVAKAADRRDIPAIWHIREFMEEDLGLGFADKDKTASLINRAKKIIAVSEAVKDKFSAMFTPDVEVVYNCFSGIGESSDHKWDAVDVFKICIVGRIRRTKGQLELIKAISLLPKEELERVEVHIFGSTFEPEYRDEIDQLVHKSHIEKQVVFEGYVSDASAIYSDAHCVCVCSDMEAFGRTTVEGMLNHCVLIGAGTGGTAELISDGTTGLLYRKDDAKDLSEKISYCINHIGECRQTANRAYEYASSRFDMDKEYKRITEMYDSIVD